MRIELIIIAIGGLVAYNIYTEGKIIKQIMAYKKYYTIVGVVLGALFFCWLFRKNPVQAHTMLNTTNEYLKYMPVDAGTKSILSPMLDFTTKRMEGFGGGGGTAGYFGGGGGGGGGGAFHDEPQQMTGGIDGEPRRFKRSVSESKKRFVAASQGWKCASCKTSLPATYEIDHIVRLDRGGSNRVDNLAGLCPNCHREKTLLENL